MVCERHGKSDRALNKRKKLLKKISNVKESINNKIKSQKLNYEGEGTISQLKKIYKQLSLMEKYKDPNEYKPTYSRIIIDSWDFNSKLGLELLNIFEEYNKI